MVETQDRTSVILLVDDEPRMLSSLSELLSLSGYQTVSAVGGLEAIKQLQQQDFCLMLLDLKMPGFSGHQVMDYVEEKSLDTTVIVMSGEVSYDAMSQVLRRRAYDYVKKPYAPDELLQTIENALKQRRLKKEKAQIAEQLKESEQLYRYMVDSSPDIVYMLDEDGKFTFVNDRVVQLLGYQKVELMGRHYSEIVCLDDTEKACHVFNERRIASRAPHNVELRLRCRDRSQKQGCFETNTIPIEINATGIYRGDHIEGKRFVGTYGVIRDISDRKEAERTIKFQAYHDLLTRLPNRALFKDRLNLAVAHAKRAHQQLAVMFLDLDRFKLVNDSLGHIFGDQLLQVVTQRLRECVREGDTLARFGGDEFTLLLPQITSGADSEVIARKIIDRFKEPFFIENNELYVTISIGIAVYPQDGSSMDELIKCSDTAMYYVKGRGKNAFQFFSSEMNEISLQRLSLERDLRKALEQKQFELYFQPQVEVDAYSSTIVAAEALIRWHHPIHGLLGPNEFISIAEDSGLILPIGEWVIEEACATLCAWKDAGFDNIRIAINLSALQVEHKNFVDGFIRIIDKYGIDGSNLEAEITENLIMQDMESNIQKLHRLSQHGVKIAIDDFGTGYSSLSYLQKLPIHTLKIDRSFITAIDREAAEVCIVDAIVAMARGMKLDLIAEGVESKNQVDYLLRVGCSCMQGYYFGKPQPSEQMLLLLAKNCEQPGQVINAS